MTTQTLPKVATRHECTLRHSVGHISNHTTGTGAPKRKRCAYCGGSFIILRGWWGVFTHSSFGGSARYALADALSLHTREAQADAIVQADETMRTVVRWVSE